MSERCSRRDPMFAVSDINNAAADFVEALSEHATLHWEADDKEALADSLVDRAFAVIRGEKADFS